MWIVVKVWSDYEQDVFEFDDEEKARGFFDSDDFTPVIYIAKVKEKRSAEG
ncbi:hypothetical protein [Bhargavaea ginsengi]|uniref:hypothetical protein n=1 Tax=Bhargavaea ginsengi TaxID=426757 RepID=UPI003C787D04